MGAMAACKGATVTKWGMAVVARVLPEMAQVAMET